MGRPNGMPKIRVTVKIISEKTNPFAKKDVISRKLIGYNSKISIHNFC
jgi:hypothetical protein